MNDLPDAPLDDTERVTLGLRMEVTYNYRLNDHVGCTGNVYLSAW